MLSFFFSYRFFLSKEKIKTAGETNSTSNPQQSSSKANDYGALTFDENAPKTESCPLNGAYYSKEQRNWWETHRPLGVMIENHVDARPQSGLSFADVIYEAVAEGGITRFLAVYYCQDAGIIGPVRSARTYFLDFISEYGNHPLYAHVGGANAPGPANALGQIETYGWAQYNDLNQFSIGFPTFRRDDSRAGHPVATEHTMYATTSKLWAVGAKRGLTNVDKTGESWRTGFVPYTFKNDAPQNKRPGGQKISLEFWGDTLYNVSWLYDPQTNLYKRENGGKIHLDRNTHQQLTSKNIVVLFMRQTHANDGYPGNVHLLYQDKGRGQALVFRDGREIKATWSKASRSARTKITDMSGQEIQFDRGKIWFEILPLGAQVTVTK